jgi:hypothetical protein
MHYLGMPQRVAAERMLAASGANLSVADVLQDLISHETIPLTDEDLAYTLRSLNFNVTRRTVAKYRAQMGIAPSLVRRANAQERARALLNELLDEHERAQLAQRGYLQIASPSRQQRFYRIPRHGGRVRMYEYGKVVSLLCVGPAEPLPTADVILLHKLMIEGNEEAYLATANHFPVGRY